MRRDWRVDRWSGWCLAAFVVLMPLSAPVGPASLNVQWSDLAALGFLASLLAAGMRRNRVMWTPWCGIGVYLGSLLPSLTQTAHLGSSFLELGKTAYLAGLGLAIAHWAQEPARWDRLVGIFVAVIAALVAMTLGVWGYAMLVGHAPESFTITTAVPNLKEMVRVKTTLLTPALLANYLTLGVPLLTAYVATRLPWPRTVGWAVLVAGILATGATVSHSLAGCLAAAALIAPRTTRWDRLGARGIGVLAVIVTVFALVSTTVAIHGVHAARAPAPTAPDSRAPHEFLGPSGTGEELTVRIRYAWVSYGLLKCIAWETWRDHVWSGIGLGEFPDAVERAFTAGRFHYPRLHPHSTWFGSLAETGLFGLGGLLGLWIAFLWPALQQWTWSGQVAEGWRIRAPMAGLLGLLVNSLHVDVMHFRFLWLGAALLLAEVVRLKATDRPHGFG